jgi:hypothetical protein
MLMVNSRGLHGLERLELNGNLFRVFSVFLLNVPRLPRNASMYSDSYLLERGHKQFCGKQRAELFVFNGIYYNLTTI